MRMYATIRGALCGPGGFSTWRRMGVARAGLGCIIRRDHASSIVVKTPAMADSITEGVLASWEKAVGDHVVRDEVIANIETDKITLPVNSPDSGVVLELLAAPGDTVVVGSDLFKLDVGAEAPAAPAKKEPAPAESKRDEREEKREPKTKKRTEEPEAREENKAASAAATGPHKTPARLPAAARQESRTKFTPMRQRIAQRLKESQDVAASLTTFNEVDMSAIIELRGLYKDEIAKKHNVKFGFMSPFVKAASVALAELPMVNARIEGGDIVTPSFVDISVAVATPKGLVTPVLRNCQAMDMIEIERALAELGERARNGQLSMEDLNGGTFTISNGGVFGSLMGTPIINVPQSAILGMHAIKDRAVAVGGAVAVRPMMYLALTYDHRIIDGREAVGFLARLKALLEDPRRFLLHL